MMVFGNVAGNDVMVLCVGNDVMVLCVVGNDRNQLQMWNHWFHWLKVASIIIKFAEEAFCWKLFKNETNAWGVCMIQGVSFEWIHITF